MPEPLGSCSARSSAHSSVAVKVERLLSNTPCKFIPRWQVWMAERNPDALATFQVRDTIGALIERAQALRVPMPTITASTTSQQGRAGTATTGVMSPGTPGQHRTAGGAGMGGGVSSSQAHVSGGAPGALYLSRLLPRYAAPLATKSVVQVSPLCAIAECLCGVSLRARLLACMCCLQCVMCDVQPSQRQAHVWHPCLPLCYVSLHPAVHCCMGEESEPHER
jgi:hypothetical protein